LFIQLVFREVSPSEFALYFNIAVNIMLYVCIMALIFKLYLYIILQFCDHKIRISWREDFNRKTIIITKYIVKVELFNTFSKWHFTRWSERILVIYEISLPYFILLLNIAENFARNLCCACLIYSHGENLMTRKHLERH